MYYDYTEFAGKNEEISNNENQVYPTIWDFGCKCGSANISYKTSKEEPTIVLNTEECLV